MGPVDRKVHERSWRGVQLPSDIVRYARIDKKLFFWHFMLSMKSSPKAFVIQLLLVFSS